MMLPYLDLVKDAKHVFERELRNLPMKIHLGDLAEINSLSKSTIENHLRSAEKKEISSESRDIANLCTHNF